VGTPKILAVGYGVTVNDTLKFQKSRNIDKNVKMSSKQHSNKGYDSK
jgi:hypothetical protein